MRSFTGMSIGQLAYLLGPASLPRPGEIDKILDQAASDIGAARPPRPESGAVARYRRLVVSVASDVLFTGSMHDYCMALSEAEILVFAKPVLAPSLRWQRRKFR